ncbi:CatA-like O-acetyltransferase [Paenibacillus pabuli]
MIWIPLSVQLHHPVRDGYHAGVMFNELQSLPDRCHEWC